MKFSLFFYPDGSETATASVFVESDNNAKIVSLYKDVHLYLDMMIVAARDSRQYADSHQTSELDSDSHKFKHFNCLKDDSAPCKVVCEKDGIGVKKGHLYINEEDAITAVFDECMVLNGDGGGGDSTSKEEDFYFESGYTDSKDLTITVEYKGDKYTDISKFGVLSCKFGFCGIKFAAEKNGGEQDTYYMTTKSIFIDPDQKFEEDTGYKILQSPSTGIIGVNSVYHYAGNCVYFNDMKKREYSYDRLIDFFDKEGNHIYYPDNREWRGKDHWCNLANLFFEKKGEEEFEFSVLINGKLHKKISKTADCMIFHDTYFSFGSPSPNRNKWDLVFKKVDGVYLIDSFTFEGSRLECKSIALKTVIDIPRLPGKLESHSLFLFLCPLRSGFI